MIVYGHIMLKIPLLVRSPKLSNVEPTLATPDNQHLLRSRFARLAPRAQFSITKLSAPAPPFLYHRHRQVGNSMAFINTRPMLLEYSYIIVLLVTAAQHRKVGLRE